MLTVFTAILIIIFAILGVVSFISFSHSVKLKDEPIEVLTWQAAIILCIITVVVLAHHYHSEPTTKQPGTGMVQGIKGEK